MLMATLVCGLSMTVTACSDDDDDNNGQEQRSDIDPLDNDEAHTAWRWLCALTNADGLDANWKSKTWEPTVGEPSENNEYTRIVVVETLDEAKVNFASIADKEPSELAGKVTVSGGAAGTMTWEPSAAGAENLAVVTVNSRIMPHLQKLVYCTADQVGSNGVIFGNNMKGTPYYRFGDVIRDADGYYWVCVRPCFAANDEDKDLYKDTKGDSHWINIFNADESGDKKPIPATYVKKDWNNLKKYDYQTILLPTGLPYDREHIFNLTQLIWALLDPAKYQTICANNTQSALGGFPYKYNGEKFLKAVSAYWDEKDEDGITIWERLFNLTHEQMQGLKQMDFMYKGYSWKWGNSGNIWSYESEGRNGDGYKAAYSGKESNDEEEVNFVESGFDINHFAGAPNSQSLPYAQFNSYGTNITHGIWVVRYMRGDKLMTGGKFSYYNKITSSKGNVKDVYRYNEKRGIDAGENIPAQTEDDITGPAKVTTVEPSFLIGSDGNFYYDAKDIQKNAPGVKPVAIVVSTQKAVEAGTNYNGLAMALYDVENSGRLRWGEAGQECGGDSCTAYSKVPQIPCNGLSVTKQLAQGCGKGHDHPAAKACLTFMDDVLSPETRQAKGLSNWFLPSVSQWKLAMEGIGGVSPNDWNDITGYMMKSVAIENYMTTLFNQAFVSDYLTAIRSAANSFWSSTPFGKQKASVVCFYWTMRGYNKDDNTPKLLPFIAFKAD